eukprot:XP_020398492.1 uncharacterized protein LOC109941697 [Zea mays]
MVMDQVGGRSRRGRRTPFLTDPEQYECGKMTQFHLLDPFYDESHRGHLLSEGQDLAALRSRTHNGFLDMVFDNRYTNYLRRAGLDVISYQLRRGLPTIDSAAITALVDRWRPETHSFHLPFDATGDCASWMYIPCLTDWDTAGHYSWGSAVLSFLYRQLCEACRRTSSSSSIGDCVYLLQIWMWFRIPVG